jgi:hypothetical protein
MAGATPFLPCAVAVTRTETQQKIGAGFGASYPASRSLRSTPSQGAENHCAAFSARGERYSVFTRTDGVSPAPTRGNGRKSDIEGCRLDDVAGCRSRFEGLQIDGRSGGARGYPSSRRGLEFVALGDGGAGCDEARRAVETHGGSTADRNIMLDAAN